MIIRRAMEPEIKALADTYPVVTISGPRQAGKTTLAKMAFPDYNYCNLEHPETRKLAVDDPKSLLQLYSPPVIIDEIQRVPEILSYIQVHVDESKKNGEFILTGSHQLSLNAGVSQSLAGRTALVTLLPFSIEELSQMKIEFDRDEFIYHGFLPRVYDQNQNPTKAYRNYLQTYVERDVRQIINIKDLTKFESFLRLLAGRVGQVLNMSSLSNDTGVSVPTINEWISVLEASHILFRLSPYYENFGKRIIKSPKFYFTDVGLVAYLLGIENEKQIIRDPLIGNLFENMVVIELLKARFNKGKAPNMYFFRDSHHNEVDVLIKNGRNIYPVEIKSSRTYNTSFTKGVQKFIGLSNSTRGFIIYAGEKTFTSNNIQVLNYKNCGDVMQ